MSEYLDIGKTKIPENQVRAPSPPFRLGAKRWHVPDKI